MYLVTINRKKWNTEAPARGYCRLMITFPPFAGLPCLIYLQIVLHVFAGLIIHVVRHICRAQMHASIAINPY